MAEEYKIWLARAKSNLALSKNKASEAVFYEFVFSGATGR